MVVLPSMSWSSSDTRMHAASPTDDDLLASSTTFSSLPSFLQQAPPPDAARKINNNGRGAVEQIKFYLLQRMRALAFIKDDGTDGGRTAASTSSSSFPASSSNHGTSSSRGDDIDRLASAPGRQESLQQQQQQQQSRTSFTHANYYDDLEEYECAACGRSTSDNPYGRFCAACTEARQGARASKGDVGILPMPPLSPGQGFATPPPTANMSHAAAAAAATAAAACGPPASTVDISKEVLGEALAKLFSPSTLRAMVMTRNAQEHKQQHKAAAINSAAVQIGKFNGVQGSPARWVNGFCQSVFKNLFRTAEGLQLLQATLTSEAQAWMHANLEEASSQDKPLEFMVLLFRKVYMSEVKIAELRTKLQSTVMYGEHVTEAELRVHYAAYMGLVNELRLCDPFRPEQQYRHDFYSSLPYCLRSFMGPVWERETTIDGIYHMAIRGVNPRDKERGHKSAARTSVDSESLSVNAFQARNQPKTVAEADRRETQCYQCGNKGHRTGGCSLIGQQQTNKGKEAWAKKNSMAGTDWVYDARYFIAYHKAKQAGGSWEDAVEAGRKAVGDHRRSGHRDHSRARTNNSGGERGAGAAAAAASSSSSSSSSWSSRQSSPSPRRSSSPSSQHQSRSRQRARSSATVVQDSSDSEVEEVQQSEE